MGYLAERTGGAGVSLERRVRYPLRAMHDLSYFRENLNVFADMAKRRGTTLDLDAFRVLDKERRGIILADEQRKGVGDKRSGEKDRPEKKKQKGETIIAERWTNIRRV